MKDRRLEDFVSSTSVEFIDNKVDLSTTMDAFLLSLRAAEALLGHKVRAKINFLGSFESREIYKKELYNYFKPLVENMCDDCKRRLQTNPLRILDCKVEEDQIIASKSPRISAYLSDSDKEEYNNIKNALDKIGIEYEVDDELVRGLDYYTGLVWELYDTENKTLGAIGGGGLGNIAIMYGYMRYNYMVILIAVVLLIVLVQVFQSAGTAISVKTDKRLK